MMWWDKILGLVVLYHLHALNANAGAIAGRTLSKNKLDQKDSSVVSSFASFMRGPSKPKDQKARENNVGISSSDGKRPRPKRTASYPFAPPASAEKVALLEKLAEEENLLASSSGNIYAYDDYAYQTTNEYYPFDEMLPECYYPTQAGYVGLQYCYGHQTLTTPPPCVSKEDLVFNNETGSFSSDQTFYNCMANIPDVASMPTFYNGKYHGCLAVTTQITLLNLVHIDEVQGIAEIQLILDFYWDDVRYNMPLFWENSQVSYSGMDLTTILTNQSTVIWRPEIVFPDAQSMEIMSETLTVQPSINPNMSVFLYELTLDIVLVQPNFNFRRYPNDEQDLVIRYSALNYDAMQLQLFPADIACSYLPDGGCSFGENPIWIWRNEPSFSSCTAYPDKKASLIWPAYVYYTVKIIRQGEGIIVRLVLPLTLLLLISALTFWVTYENRVDTTITLLLSVSALYIIILQSIPLVGYLTDIDKFVFWMFLLLCFVVAMHQAYATLFEKVDVWPLRLLYLRLIELIGRCFVPPAIIFYFLKTIEFGDHHVRVGMTATTVVLISVLFIREVFGVRSAYYKAIERLVDKFNRANLTTKEVSYVEILALNTYFFKKWSMSWEDIATELTTKGKLHFEKPTSIMVKNMSSLANMMAGVHGGLGDKNKHDSVKAEGSFLRRFRTMSNNDDPYTHEPQIVEMSNLFTSNTSNGANIASMEPGNGGLVFKASYAANSSDANALRHRTSSSSSATNNSNTNSITNSNNNNFNNSNDNGQFASFGAANPLHPHAFRPSHSTNIDSDDEEN